ncbi:hypothetical protein BLAT2472_10531 [Burkholderia latens]
MTGKRSEGEGSEAQHAADAMRVILIRPGEISLWNLIYRRWLPAC